MKQKRLFLFGCGSDGRASVLCQHCGWKRQRRTADPQAVYDLAETHECEGVETVAEMNARLSGEVAS